MRENTPMTKKNLKSDSQRLAKKYELYKVADKKSGIEAPFFEASDETTKWTEFIDPTHPFQTAGVELGAAIFHVRYKTLPSHSNANVMNNWFSVLNEGANLNRNITRKEMLDAIKIGIVSTPPSPYKTSDAQRRINAICVLLHERLGTWVNEYGTPENKDIVIMHDLIELALEFEFIYDYYFAVQRAKKVKDPIKMRISPKSDAVIEMTQQDASVLAAAFLYKKLEANNVNVLHYPEPKDLVSTMWSETNFIFSNKTILKPCANIWKPCLSHIADNSKRKTCSDACRNRVIYWKEQNNAK